MTTVAAAQRQGAVAKVAKCRDGSAGRCDNLGCPANIGVPHSNRPARIGAAGLRLDEGKVGVPANIDPRNAGTGLRQQSADLRLVTLEQYDLDRNFASSRK